MQRIIAAAIIKHDKVLIAERNYGSLKGYWEFPGGKVECNETDEECICREIKEEFGVDIQVSSYLGQAKFQIEENNYEIILYEAKLLSDHLRLTVHSKIKWVSRNQLYKNKLAPVDITLATRCFGGV